METKHRMPSRLKEILFGLWSLLFVGLLVVHLIVSFRLSTPQFSEVHSSRPAAQDPSALIPAEAKLIAIVLMAFLILIVWRKTRVFAGKAFGIIISFGPLAFGWYQTARAFEASDLSDYAERYSATSTALLVSLAWAVSSSVLVFAKSRLQKQTAPPVIPKVEASSG